MPSAICFNLDQSKTLSSGNELSVHSLSVFLIPLALECIDVMKEINLVSLSS